MIRTVLLAAMLAISLYGFSDSFASSAETSQANIEFTNTGSVSLDRARYPFPIGPEMFELKNHSIDNPSYLGKTDLIIHVRIFDPDFDVNMVGKDTIDVSGTGPVKISVMRGVEEVVLGYAGGRSVPEGKNFGAIEEIAPDTGIFEAAIPIAYTDGPPSYNGNCPINVSTCIQPGDILRVEYTDPIDASGESNTVTDSATFGLSNGVLQSDKSVYIIGSDIILTLIEPDFDLDNDQAETYPLNLIGWNSSAATIGMGESTAFAPEPSDLRETGDSTGIFQTVVKMPIALDGNRLERDEKIELVYTDFGPPGAVYVGEISWDTTLEISTSNFGATVELDQKVYTWTDKVYITIVAPDYNFDSNLVDEIGGADWNSIKVSTRSSHLDNYKLVETGTDTGIFTGEIVLTGFAYDADGNTTTGQNGTGYDILATDPEGTGPTDGKLPSGNDDELSVSFEHSKDNTVITSAIIRWNIGEIQWLEPNYLAIDTGIVRIIDPDINLNPEIVDSFKVDVWSESDTDGIDLTVIETNDAAGIFEGTVFFDVNNDSAGHRLRVAEGDTVTAEYEDNTLPAPDSAGDSLRITATTLIGSIVPPLERAPASDLRIVDANGNSLDNVSVDQQVLITADLTNNQDRDQEFTFLVRIQDSNGVTLPDSWLSSNMAAGQTFTVAQSWTPIMSGTYTITVHILESIYSAAPLSPSLSTTIQVTGSTTSNPSSLAITTGTVLSDVDDDSIGHRLRVSEGDTVTAEYEDNTLPAPDSAGDSLRITATTLIGSIVPPLERAPASDLRIVDANGNSLDNVSVDQQVQVAADLMNGQNADQTFVYLVHIQDENGVTVALSWIGGDLTAEQKLQIIQSWTPTEAGDYTITVFVWESIESPTALSPPLSIDIQVTDSTTSNPGSLAVTTGTVFSDVNKNAVRDAGEAGLEGIGIICVLHDLVNDLRTTSDVSGTYRFETQSGCYLTQAEIQDWEIGDPNAHVYTPAHEGQTITHDFASWQEDRCESGYAVTDGQCVQDRHDTSQMLNSLIATIQSIKDELAGLYNKIDMLSTQLEAAEADVEELTAILAAEP